MKKLLLICLVVWGHSSFAQTMINGALDPTTATRFQFLGQFMGFNDGPFTSELGMGINAKTTGNCSTCDGSVHPAFYNLQDDLLHFHRFSGGQFGNYYHRWYGGSGNSNTNTIYNNPYYIVSNSGYAAYAMRNIGPQPAQSNNNVIFPFINKLTHHNLSGYTAESNFVLNILEHYRKYTLNSVLYNPRHDVFANKAIIETITTKAQLDANTVLSATFKQIVQENLDALKTLLDNHVTVKHIELGNEFSGNGFFDAKTVNCVGGTLTNNTLNNYNKFLAGDNISKITGAINCSSPVTVTEATQERLFFHVPVTVSATTYDARTTYTLDCYAALCKMYINIIRNYFPAQNFKFGLPYGQAAYNSTVSAWTYNYQNNPWNNYLVIPKKAYIGYDAVIIHMYPGPADSVSMGLANDAYFAAIVPKLTNKLTQEVSVNALNKHAASLPANTEIWLTEWNWSNANYATTNNSLRFNNTMLDLYGKCEFLFAMIDANTFHATKKNLYRVANHHMFNGPLNGSNGSTNYGTVLVNLPYGGALFKRAAYYAFKIMQPVIDNRTGLQYITTTNSGFTNVPSGVKFRAFYKSGGECNYDVGELLLYYSNTSGVDYAVNVNSYLSPMFGSNPSYYVPNGLASNYDAWATKFQASCGASYSTGSEPGNTDAYFVSNPTDATKNIQVMSAPTSLTNTALSNVPIQKYAVGYIRVPIRQQVGFVTCVSKSGNLTTESGGRNGLTIYPNPSNDILNLELASISSGACTIFLYDLTGRLIQAKSIEIESGFNATRLDVSSLLPATYIVKVQFNGTLLAQKIQVIR